MHYLSQSLAILLTLFILVLWRVHKKTGTSNEPIFFMLIITALVSEILDIFTQFAIAPYPLYTSELVNKIVIKAYLLSIIAYMFGVGLYTNKSINKTSRMKKVGKQMIAILAVSSIITCVLKVDYVYHPDCSMISGPAFVFVMGINAAVGIYYSIVLNKKKDVSTWSRAITTAWVTTFVLGIVFQFFTIDATHLPVISLTMAVCIMFLFLCNENPGSKFDYNSDCFYYETFVEYLQDIIANNVDQACLMISIHVKNSDNMIYCSDVFESIIYDKQYASLKFFKGALSELYISADNQDTLKKIESEVIDKVVDIEKNNNQVKLYTTIVLIPNVKIVKPYQVVKSIFDYYRSREISDSENIIVEYIDDQLLEKYKNRFIIVEEIEKAVRNDRVKVFYQTINNNSNDMIYAQAYSDIYLEDNSVLTTNEYYEIAVEYDQLRDIRRTKLKSIKETIEEIISNENNNLALVFLNTSVQELEDERYYDEFVSAFGNNDRVLSRTCLEITNIETIVNKDMLLDNINRLQEHGVKLAVSGFGNGEANLNYFIDLPIHFIRFDISIFEKAINEQNVLMVIKDVTNLAHSLNLNVIAIGEKSEEFDKVITECGIHMFFSENDAKLKGEVFTTLCLGNKGGKE